MSSLGKDVKITNNSSLGERENRPSQNWSAYPATNNVDMNGFAIENVIGVATDNIDVTNDLVVGGNTDILGTTNTNDLNVGNDLDVIGNITASNNLDVSGIITGKTIFFNKLIQGVDDTDLDNVDLELETNMNSGNIKRFTIGKAPPSGSGNLKGNTFIIAYEYNSVEASRECRVGLYLVPAMRFRTYETLFEALPVRINEDLTVTGVTDITDTTNSTSETTGALTVAGGVGIGKELYVGGNKINFSTTDDNGNNPCIRTIQQGAGNDTCVNINKCEEAGILNLGSDNSSNTLAVLVGTNKNSSDWTSENIVGMGFTSTGSNFLLGGVGGVDKRPTSNGAFRGGVSLYARTGSGTNGLFGDGTSDNNIGVLEFLRCDGLDEIIYNYYQTEITDSTTSSSPTTGALTVAGGVGINDNLTVANTTSSDRFIYGVQTRGVSADFTLTTSSPQIQSCTLTGTSVTYKCLLPNPSGLQIGSSWKISFTAGATNQLDIRDNADTTTFVSLTSVGDTTELIYDGANWLVF